MEGNLRCSHRQVDATLPRSPGTLLLPSPAATTTATATATNAAGGDGGAAGATAAATSAAYIVAFSPQITSGSALCVTEGGSAPCAPPAFAGACTTPRTRAASCPREREERGEALLAWWWWREVASEHLQLQRNGGDEHEDT